MGPAPARSRRRKKFEGGWIEVYGERFELVRTSEAPENRFVVRHRNRTIGWIEPFMSQWNTEHWMYRDGMGIPRGSGSTVSAAVDRLFSAIRGAKAEARKPFLPPMTLDGITFVFDRGEEGADDHCYDSDIVRAARGERVRRPRIVISHCVRVPAGISSLHDPTESRLDYIGSVFTDTNSATNELWSAEYGYDAFQRYSLNEWVPLETAVRWLYLHGAFRRLRRFTSLSKFSYTILKLIESHEALNSVNTFRELCCLTPSLSETWKIYARSNDWLKVQDPPPDWIPDAYKLVFEGDVEAVRNELNSKGTAGVIVLNPQNRIVD